MLYIHVYIYQQGFSPKICSFKPHLEQFLPPPKISCLPTNKPIKSSFLTAVIVPAPFFFLTSYSLYTQVMLISILIDIQYLQNDVFYFEKGLNDQMHCSSDAQYLIKQSTPSKISHCPSTRGIFSPTP